MRPWPLIALVGVLLFASGWALRDHFARADRARHEAAGAQALADAVRNARAIEQGLVARMESLHDETEQRLAAVAAAERRAADERVRDLAAGYAARQRDADASAVAGQCAASAAAAGVLAGLLGELDELAEGYAAEADRRRIAGLACESAWESARGAVR